ncbi:MFS transporter [Niallia sp. NCCP-28]|uniref:MFS transporter n=1 Tax=Niallia sp. NCCP-28 TaxID=2934712 RepID=UPI0020844310|nr:MFS transporter [Niallia sp. NCCP-28]GKU84774.1 MFS transporter [Niallia sp. NCCP-28]
MSKEALWTKGFISIWISNFFLFLTFYYLLVSLPIYAINHLHGHQASAGLIVTIFLISAIVIRPFAGNFMQKIGKKPIFIVALVLFLMGTLLYFLPQSVGGLLLVRAFHGIGFGIATTATGTIVADLIPNSRRGEGMGYYSMSMNLAMVIGPFLGLMAINSWGVQLLFIIASICALLSLGTGLAIKLPKQENRQVHAHAKQKHTFKWSNIFEPSALSISFVAALFGIAYSSILSFVSVYANSKGLASVSGYFFVVYAVLMLMARPFTGRWFDRYGANVIIYPCIVLFAVGMFILSGMHTAGLFLVSAGLIGIGYGTLFPSFQTIAIQSAEPQRRGLATATFLSLFDSGIGIGSFLVGFIGDKIGFSSLYFYTSIYVLLGLAVYYFMYGKKVKRNVGKLAEKRVG